MSIQKALIDTDILSAIMRKNVMVQRRATEYLKKHNHFTISIITRYEILRGLKVKGATNQEKVFDRLCSKSKILPITDEIINRATEVYADLHKRGLLIGDADILI